MAGGFSVETSKIKDLHRFFCEQLATKIDKILSENLHEYDLALDLEQLNIDLVKELAKLEPFGIANPRPRFLLSNLFKIRANQSKLTTILVELKSSQNIQVIGTVDINSWMGVDKLSLQIEDLIL